ncbi:ABC transporter substrate-binding protein [Homoserinimonas sp. OAct 916]|uniref:ABC transporter substrate-binding protein n=1 Tax=Homoserinimonas sp. OAct 916 TaxID=2211450 RepID=UPI0018E56A0D|nr:ABC transporter substrate-binding protein [Homoserinimonas sp. OAct 916]
MKKKVLGVATVALLAMGLTACGANPAADPAPAPDATAAGSDSEIVIGASLCLTGIQSPLDEPILRGAQLAVDEINTNGGVLGKQLKLVNLDGKSDPVVVGNNGEQLTAQGAAAIITPADFDFGGPASRAAQAAGIVGISPGASSPLFGAATLGDKQFTLSMWNTTMGAAAAEWAYNERGLKKAYVVTDSFIDYTTSLSEYFIESMEHQGGTIVGQDTYTQGDQNFSAQLQRLKTAGSDADVIFVSSYMPDLGLIIRDIRAAGIDTPIFGGDSYDDPELAKVLGAEFGNDITYATHAYLSEEASALVPDFLSLYEKAHGEEPDTALVANGYDTVNVLAQAMEAAGSTDGAAVAAKMTSMKFELLTGNLTWSAETGNEPQKEAVLVSLDKGEPKFNGWLMPQWVPAA